MPAGIDRFPADLVRHYFGGANGENESTLAARTDRRPHLGLGRESDPVVFNMAHMGLRLGQRANGVSKLHGIVSREMFDGLWPGFDAAEVPIGSVTNGVHAPTWAAPEWMDLGQRTRRAGACSRRPAAGSVCRSCRSANCGRRVTRCARSWWTKFVDGCDASWLERGATEAELGWTTGCFRPERADRRVRPARARRTSG